MKPGLWEQLEARANGACECCGSPMGIGFERPTADHFWGRGKEEEDLTNVWVLRLDHHARKTSNEPNAATWLMKFAGHCATHGYRASYEKALRKLSWHQTRDGFEVGK